MSLDTPEHSLKGDRRGRLAMTVNQLALALRVAANRITAILRGERAVTAETAPRLGRYLGTGAEFWMNLQTTHDISVVAAERGKRI